MNAAATSVVVAVWLRAQCSRLSRIPAQISQGVVRSIFIGSYYDSTPTLVSFGALQDVVMPHARYLHLGEDGKWKALTLEKYVHVTSRAAPRCG
eukprot:15437881-Alexandrium_andersonii.AAC.1